MSTMIFVHGISVRRLGFNETFEKIGSELAKRKRDDITFTPCFWGEKLGAKWLKIGACIPRYNKTKGLEQIAPEDDESERWVCLRNDPLWELRVLTLAPSTKDRHIVGQVNQGKQLLESARKLVVKPALKAKLQAAGIDDYFETSRDDVTNSPICRDAFKKAGESFDDYKSVLARAIVAQAMLLAEQQALNDAIQGVDTPLPTLVHDSELRDDVVREIGSSLADQFKGIGGWVAGALKAVATRVGFLYRGRITDSLALNVGDTLIYQARGKEIRSLIAQTVEQAEEPVILFSHSLGGVACVDLLIERHLPKVAQLITVGSQAPLFYEIDALQSLRFGEKLPGKERFPDWLNIYDLRDFLSYIGEPVFGERVTDIEVNNRQPFPESHNAYWSNSRMWEEVLRRVPNK